MELHLHLEGAIPLPALWKLVRKYGGDADVKDSAALAKKFRYRDFPHFIETWQWKNGYLREYEDFTWMAQAVATDLAEQNVRYAEVFFSPADFAQHGLAPGRLTESIRIGLDTQKERIEIQLIADLVRDFGPEKGMRTLQEVAEVRDLGVIGIGIGGSEQSYPPEPYREVYAKARQLGFHTTAHAGEAAGAESVWGAIRALEVDRIGHGTRAAEDPDLVTTLKERQIPIEMCPLSNVRTGVVTDLGEHPIHRFFEEGLLVSVNTDDPKMFDTDLETEYAELAVTLNFERADITQLLANAVRSAWCDETKKGELLRELNQRASI